MIKSYIFESWLQHHHQSTDTGSSVTAVPPLPLPTPLPPPPPEKCILQAGLCSRTGQRLPTAVSDKDLSDSPARCDCSSYILHKVLQACRLAGQTGRARPGCEVILINQSQCWCWSSPEKIIMELGRLIHVEDFCSSF